MKRKKKILSLILTVMLLCGLVMPLTAMEASAATHTIVFQGRISIPESSTTVGKFMIDGQRAFCLEHTELAPPNGATTTSEIYHDPDIAKVLYYGWTGPGQWSGFKNEDHGIMITSLVLAYYYGALGGDYSYLDGWDGFMEYLGNQPAVQNERVAFNKESLTPKWDVKKQKQILIQ